MSPNHRAGSSLIAVAALLVLGGAAAAQDNPYRVASEAFGQLPDGRRYGAVSAVYPGPYGRTIRHAERCGQTTAVHRHELKPT